MIGISFHELSHLQAAKKLGLQSNGFFLIPFIGGVAFTKGDITRFSQQVFIVIMGPLGGAFLAFFTYLLFLISHSIILGEAAQLMAFFNLFNLIPLSFLDGGQLLECLAFSINKPALGIIILFLSAFLAIPVLFPLNPILALIIGFLGLMKVYYLYKHYKSLDKTSISNSQIHQLLDLSTPLSNKQLLQTIAAWILTSLFLIAIICLSASQGLNFSLLFKK